MNRLIIIGNGFDLAHGLKTGYSDFIDWLLQSAIDGGNEHNTLFEVNWNSPIASKNIDKRSLIVTAFRNEHRMVTERFLIIKNQFFRSLILSPNEGWVDIEKFYFKHLLAKIKSGDREKGVRQLNQEFSMIKDLLERYLTKEYQKYISKKENLGYDHIFIKDTPSRGYAYFLNFNYTSLPNQYFKGIFKLTAGQVNYSINQIHGQLNSKDNPIIFGYGDEKHHEYDKILQMENDEILRNFKHYRYTLTKNYNDLMDFLNSGAFEIFIMGHSCGTSDRTLFNEIFEHPKLIPYGIKIFVQDRLSEKNKLTSFSKKVMQISRVLNNSGDVRKKVLNYTKLNIMPTV